MTWLPVWMNEIAGSWLIASVCIDRMNAILSTNFDVCGNNSLTHIPESPYWAKLYLLGAIGNRDWPLVIVVKR